MIIKDKSYGVILILRKENTEDRFLILHQTKGHWSFPKGHKEKDESSIESAQRELEEETDIKNVTFAELPTISEKYSFKEGGKHYDKIVEYFIAFTEEEKIKIQDSEIIDYKWATFKEAMDTFTFPEVKQVLIMAKKYINLEGISRELAVVNTNNISKQEYDKLPKIYKSKAIIINTENKIILIHTNLKNKLNIPGGKMENGESIFEALSRECKEETGCNISIINTLGYVKLYRKDYISINFIFIAEKIGVQEEMSLMEDEISEGHEVVYKTMKEIIYELDSGEKNYKVSTLAKIVLLEAQKYLKNE
ncbi:MAG: NUDIX hydrolase [Candidatus Pacebacteria bacterium]|nr:NUDIX hydrolase [Candidatus Paceibacterota bacterium]